MLTKRGSEINRKIKSREKETTDLDRIIAYMTSTDDSIKLNPKETEIFQRIDYAYSHLQEYTDYEVKNMLVRKFNVSKSTAYNDINTAYLVHGKTGRLRRDVEIYFLLQDARIAIRNAHESKNNNQLIKAIESKAKVLALIKEEDPVDWDKIQPSNFYLILNQGTGKDSGQTSLKIDLNKVSQLDDTELQQIQQQLMDHFSQETIDIIEQHGNVKAGK